MHAIGSQIGQFLARQEQQRHIARLNRIYAVLSGINSTIVRVREREELLREACGIVVRAGGFRLAWLGLVDAEANRVKPMAWEGVGEDYIGMIPLGLDENAPGEYGLAGRAVKERKAMIVYDMTMDPRVTLRKETHERGFRSLAMLPLLVAEVPVGVLALYADSPGFFDDEDEMRLLLELAGDIAFALEHIEKGERLNYLAYYDPLTGLANATLFRERLARFVEAALKTAKETNERYIFYTHELTERIAERLSLENKLRQALERQEFVLHYQPKVETDTRRVVGVEALIRWVSPERGLVPPLEFIPLLEETGLILEVGGWALEQAVRDHAHWLQQGIVAPRIAVNVSAIQLRRPNFVAIVEAAIKRGASPHGLDLEITESLLMEEVAANIEKLRALRELGVSVSIDDFGTGYSSLGYLAKLPVQSLKIDRSFIITMLKEPDTMTLVSTMISLARALRLKVIAEGVDAEDQANFLRLARCDEMQGYLIGKPVPRGSITALLRTEGAVDRRVSA